jgi:hypothetical protein
MAGRRLSRNPAPVRQRMARRDLSAWTACVPELRDQFWALLRERIPGLVLNGHVSERLPNTLNVRFRVSPALHSSRRRQRSPRQRAGRVTTVTYRCPPWLSQWAFQPQKPSAQCVSRWAAGRPVRTSPGQLMPCRKRGALSDDERGRFESTRAPRRQPPARKNRDARLQTHSTADTLRLQDPSRMGRPCGQSRCSPGPRPPPACRARPRTQDLIRPREQWTLSARRAYTVVLIPQWQALAVDRHAGLPPRHGQS